MIWGQKSEAKISKSPISSICRALGEFFLLYKSHLVFARAPSAPGGQKDNMRKSGSWNSGRKNLRVLCVVVGAFVLCCAAVQAPCSSILHTTVLLAGVLLQHEFSFLPLWLCVVCVVLAGLAVENTSYKILGKEVLRDFFLATALAGACCGALGWMWLSSAKGSICLTLAIVSSCGLFYPCDELSFAVSFYKLGWQSRVWSGCPSAACGSSFSVFYRAENLGENDKCWKVLGAVAFGELYPSELFLTFLVS